MTTGSDPRYPIGHFSAAHPLAQISKAAQVDVLRRLPMDLRAAVSGLQDAQLDTPYRDGGWTVRQVVHHVADSHLNSYTRFKLALTENTPTIKPYDEAAWAQLTDSALPVEPSLRLVEALHTRWVTLLDGFSEADFTRAFQHPERGRQDLGTALALYAWHSQHHTAHITRLRERMNW